MIKNYTFQMEFNQEKPKEHIKEAKEYIKRHKKPKKTNNPLNSSRDTRYIPKTKQYNSKKN